MLGKVCLVIYEEGSTREGTEPNTEDKLGQVFKLASIEHSFFPSIKGWVTKKLSHKRSRERKFVYTNLPVF
jgi:hypothetical protein